MYCVENKKDGLVSINKRIQKKLSSGLYLSFVPAFVDGSAIMKVCKNGNWPDMRRIKILYVLYENDALKKTKE